MALLDDYLTWLEHNRGRTDATLEKYGGYLRLLQASLERQGVALETAELKHLERFTGLEAHERGISPRSRRPLVSAVRGFYTWADQAGLIKPNPAERLPYPRAGQPLPKSLSLKHAEALMMAPDITTFTGLRDAAILAVLFGCGLRVTGVCNLNEQDLQWVQLRGQEWLVLRVREKGRKERLVPAPQETRLLIRAYLGHEKLEEIDRTLPSRDKVLFVSTCSNHVPPHEYYGENRRISRKTISSMIMRHGERLGIPKVLLHPHAARHLYGTELAEEGVDVLQIQALMGHADPKTSAIYTHMAMRTLTERVAAANPLSKVHTPVSDLVRALDRPAPRSPR